MCVLALCNNVSVALGTLYEAQPMFLYNQAINLHHVQSILQASVCILCIENPDDIKRVVYFYQHLSISVISLYYKKCTEKIMLTNIIYYKEWNIHFPDKFISISVRW